jgi:hypothetical protein
MLKKNILWPSDKDVHATHIAPVITLSFQQKPIELDKKFLK